MVTREGLKGKLPSLILSLINKTIKNFKLKHTPFILNVGIKNMRRLLVVDTRVGVSMVNSEILDRIQKITPQTINIYQYEVEIQGANSLYNSILLANVNNKQIQKE